MIDWWIVFDQGGGRQVGSKDAMRGQAAVHMHTVSGLSTSATVTHCAQVHHLSTSGDLHFSDSAQTVHYASADCTVVCLPGVTTHPPGTGPPGP